MREKRHRSCRSARHRARYSESWRGNNENRSWRGWSDEAFSTVEQVGLLYRPDEVVLVHGVDLGMFQSPIVAGAVNLQGYDEFRQALMDAGRQAVERCRTLLPAETPSIRTLCEVQHPAAFILDSAAR